MLERIVYTSRSAPGTSLDTVYSIIRGSHARNARSDVTGALVYLDGYFAQVIEGPSGTIGSLYHRITQDPRHVSISLRSRERVNCRLFRGQPMALRTRACLLPELLDSFGYAPGFPVAQFPSDVLVEFMVRACRPNPSRGTSPPLRRAAG